MDPAAYVGRPAGEAKKALEDLGLSVEEVPVDNPGTAGKDTVADVSPTGQVDPGSTVTLSVYGDPPRGEDGQDPGGHHGHDKGDKKGKKH